MSLSYECVEYLQRMLYSSNKGWEFIRNAELEEKYWCELYDESFRLYEGSNTQITANKRRDAR